MKDCYDAFISYRRIHGSDLARFIRSELEKHNYRVFLDVEDLNAGHFSEYIEGAIESSNVFIFLITEGSFERLFEKNDVVRQELESAIRYNKVILPINVTADLYPKLNAYEDAPEFIRQLSTHNILDYNHKTANHVIEKLIRSIKISRDEKFKIDFNSQQVTNLPIKHGNFSAIYTGKVRTLENGNIVPCGFGTLKDEANDLLYSGEWYGLHGHNLSGTGEIYKNSKLIYVGEWFDLHYAGISKLIEADGVYEGSFVEGKKWGKGHKIFTDGGIYEGYWENDNIHGYGRFSYADRSEFIGYFVNNERTDYGKLIKADGTKYIGMFERDYFTYGVIVYPNGLRFEGKCACKIYDIFHEGTVYLQDHKMFAGTWSDGWRKEGADYSKEGYIYKGFWKHDLPDGPFSIISSETGETIFEGNMKQGKKHGKGRFVYSDGQCYLGDWEEDRRHGKGVLKLKDGSISYQGEWKYDRPVEAIYYLYFKYYEFALHQCSQEFEADADMPQITHSYLQMLLTQDAPHCILVSKLEAEKMINSKQPINYKLYECWQDKDLPPNQSQLVLFVRDNGMIKFSGFKKGTELLGKLYDEAYQLIYIGRLYEGIANGDGVLYINNRIETGIFKEGFLIKRI